MRASLGINSIKFKQWLATHENRFDSHYERMFAENVLSGVQDLNLSTVTVQYHFRDLDGKNRYCDFVIQEASIRIAIEVDGYDKRNTGQGMSHDDFVDWQRRQAALTASGWHVLRFANRDVRDHPQRCQRYIELLLRDQRSKSQHQADLEVAIARMGHELKVAQHKTGSIEQVEKLAREISLLKKQLSLAKSVRPLSDNDKQEMQQLVDRLEQENRELKIAHERAKQKNEQLSSEKNVLDGENSAMKTTVWAFTVIISMLIMVGAYIFVNIDNNKPQMTQAAVHNAKEAVASHSAGNSCEAPISWQNAMDYVDQEVAVLGTVAEYSYLPKVNGAPTWLNLGAKYPEKNRFSLVIWGDYRSQFGAVLSRDLVSKQICAIGVVKLWKGIPQMEIKRPNDLILK